MAIRHVVPILGLAVALAGCGAVGAIDLFKRREPQPPLANQQLPPPVDTSQLPPLSDGSQIGGAQSYDQPLPQPGVVADATPPPAAGIGRTDLLGGWTITSGADSCQLFMTLTSWTGGYRATTRGCNSDFLKSISAWNLNGSQVVLASMAGTPIAHLKSIGLNRFDGTQDTQGATVAFYR
jgi:hypothetical protein